MIKLNQIVINGFKTKNRKVTVDFSDDNISVIYGYNGSGKTSFLKILYAVLSQNESMLLNESVHNISISYTNHDGVSQRVEIKALGENEDTDNNYDWEDFVECELNNSRSISLGVQRGVTVQQVYVRPQVIYDIFSRNPRFRRYLPNKVTLRDVSEELSDALARKRSFQKSIKGFSDKDYVNFDENHIFLQSVNIEHIERMLIERYRLARDITTGKIQNALFDTLALAINPESTSDGEIDIPDEFTKILMNNKERLIEALESHYENVFKDKIIEILKGIEDDKSCSTILENELLSKLIFNMIKELEVEKQILSSINLLVDTFNDFLIDEKKLILKYDGIYVRTEDSKHYLNELSSGERHILTFLALVLIEGENRNYLIIDEPEISLNLKWQREIMTLFKKLIPDTQIIVASHSPALAKNNPNYLVELKVEKAEEGNEIRDC